jgi:hypothetical protein
MRWTADPPSPRLRRDKNLRRSFGYSLIVVGQQKRSFRETTGQRDYRAKRGRYQMSHVRGQQKAKSWEMRAKPLRQDGDSVTRRYHLGKRPPAPTSLRMKLWRVERLRRAKERLPYNCTTRQRTADGIQMSDVRGHMSDVRAQRSCGLEAGHQGSGTARNCTTTDVRCHRAQAREVSETARLSRGSID